MKKMLTYLLLLTTIQVQCQEKVDISEYHSSFKVDQDKFKGEGWDKLLNEASSSSVVLIGEDHGLAEIPFFAQNMSSTLNNAGFNSYLGEVGPISMDNLLAEMQDGNHQVWISNNSLSIPFLNWAEEMNLIEALNEGEFNVYGIDQEFLLSSKIHFSRLLNLTKDAKYKDDLNEMIKREERAINNLRTQGNYLDLFMVSAIPEDFEKLKKMANSDEAKAIVEALQNSFKVYRTMMNGNGKESNELRQQLMKTNYARIKNENPNTKMIIKLGAIHCYREDAPTGVEEIGEYVAKRDSSFHLLVLGNKGTFNNYTAQSGFNEKQKSASYHVKKRFPVDLSAFLAYVDEDEWSYFDLKSIRKSKKEYNSAVNSLAKSFDGLIIIPKVTAATNLE